MTRRRSIVGDFWLQLTLQTAFLVTAVAAQAVEPAYSKAHMLSTPADDAFVFVAPAEQSAHHVTFEDFAMDFYLPPEPAPVYDTYIDSAAPLPHDDYALLGGPDYYHADEFIFGN